MFHLLSLVAVVGRIIGEDNQCNGRGAVWKNNWSIFIHKIMVDSRQLLGEIWVSVLCLLSLEALLWMNISRGVSYRVPRSSCWEESNKTVNTTCLTLYRFFYLFICSREGDNYLMVTKTTTNLLLY